jgi:hypothetical protein
MKRSEVVKYLGMFIDIQQIRIEPAFKSEDLANDILTFLEKNQLISPPRKPVTWLEIVNSGYAPDEALVYKWEEE